MSTLRTINVIHPSGSTTNIVNDSSGNVTVGNDLTVTGALVPSSSFKRNRIINGNMAVAQRGTTFTSPVDYTLDRWGIGNTGAAPASAAQVAGPSGFQYALQVTGSASNTITAIYQKIESRNTADLVGKSVTISAVIFCSTAQTVAWNLLYPSAVDNFATTTSIQTGGWSATTSAQTFTATITGLPAGVANGLQLNIYPANAGAFTSGTITLTGVQLEVGTKATPYEMQIYSDQLAQCQRYLPAYIPTTAGTAQGPMGQCYLTTDSLVAFPFQVVARVAPTGVAVTNATNFSLTQSSSARSAVTVITFHGASPSSAVCNISVASGIVAGNATMLWTATIPCQILFTGCEL
jgi:hypothetical protein